MSKASWEDDFEMEPEYDFSKGSPNPYAEQFGEGTVIVLLDADVAARFPDSESVNAALRLLMAQRDVLEELPRAS